MAPPAGDKHQGVRANPDLKEDVSAKADDRQEAGVLLQRRHLTATPSLLSLTCGHPRASAAGGSRIPSVRFQVALPGCDGSQEPGPEEKQWQEQRQPHCQLPPDKERCGGPRRSAFHRLHAKLEAAYRSLREARSLDSGEPPAPARKELKRAPSLALPSRGGAAGKVAARGQSGRKPPPGEEGVLKNSMMATLRRRRKLTARATLGTGCQKKTGSFVIEEEEGDLDYDTTASRAGQEQTSLALFFQATTVPTDQELSTTKGETGGNMREALCMCIQGSLLIWGEELHKEALFSPPSPSSPDALGLDICTDTNVELSR
ncbi:uncharacterized protein LOC133373982 [Rhineura floridana]|uniref:uncharacterized protein LOC133373982 n=1 Tax=Rhineura floridana TaxID=261503 RepID=UPI002AC89355|nr:uncharacterized protein LOC133373982 [Rhineura floridana]